MRFLLLYALLAGCGADPQVLVSYDATVASMRTLVEDHADTAASASSLDEIEATEADYQSAWATLTQEMTDEMAEMDGCTMSHGKTGADVAMGMMDDADTTNAMMDHDMTTHMADHADHSDVTECQSEESDHLDVMSAMFDDMASYSDEWRSQRMSCPGS